MSWIREKSDDKYAMTDVYVKDGAKIILSQLAVVMIPNGESLADNGLKREYQTSMYIFAYSLYQIVRGNDLDHLPPFIAQNVTRDEALWFLGRLGLDSADERIISHDNTLRERIKTKLPVTVKIRNSELEYAQIEKIVYKLDEKGQPIVLAALIDKNGNSRMYAKETDVGKMETLEENV